MKLKFHHSAPLEVPFPIIRCFADISMKGIVACIFDVLLLRSCCYLTFEL